MYLYRFRVIKFCLRPLSNTREAYLCYGITGDRNIETPEKPRHRCGMPDQKLCEKRRRGRRNGELKEIKE